MDSVAVSDPQTGLFSMTQQADNSAAADVEQPAPLVAVDANGSSDATSFTAPSLFSTPASLTDLPVSSSEPSPVNTGPQELQLAPTTAAQEQRTIFVAGFPLDMTEREFHCLLTFLPGYEACQLSWGTGAPQGFALFDSNAEASAAVDRLVGHQLEVGAVLRAELAHKNLVIKKEASMPGAQLSLLNNLQPRTDAIVTPGLGLPFSNMFQTTAQPIMAQQGYNGVTAAAAVGGLTGSPNLLPHAWRALGNARDNAPCNTLFIGNLGESTREDELHQLMASQNGFRQLKWSPTGKGIIAFVEFDDVASAAYVHGALQGFILPSNERGGIRIQFSKNPLGKRSPGDTAPNLHGLFGPANRVGSAGIQAQVLYNAGLINPVGITGLAPAVPCGFMGGMDMPQQAAAATAAAMAAAAAAAATQGMVTNTSLFGPVGNMLL